MKKQKKGRGKNFWNMEYGGRGGHGTHLALSDDPSEDLQKFTRWLQRETGNEFLNKYASVVDLGCGNGRNLVWLSKEFGMKGVGYDISEQAIMQARKASEGLNLEYQARSIIGDLPLPDESQNIVLDMMVSHFLKADERKKLIDEIYRILRPGGWLYFKTFLREGDRHAHRMIREHPASEEGSYIHPEIGVAEHVATEEEIEEALKEKFQIHKVLKSHGHLRNKAKRRSISVYAERM